MDRKTLLLTISSGCLLILSFPKVDYNFLIWISLVPLLIALRDKTPVQALIAGLVTGVIYNIGILYWVTFVVVQYGYLPLSLGIAAMLLLSLYMSLYVGVFSAGVVFCRSKGYDEAISGPLLWTCLEFGKSHLLTGFPWENLAYSLHDNLHLIQIVDVTGIYGLTFFIVFINCVVYKALMVTAETKRPVLAGVIAAVVMTGIIFSYGTYRLNAIRAIEERRDESLRVAVVQGNIDQSVKWNRNYQLRTLNIYRELTPTALQTNPGLIVWPETAMPFFFQNIDEKHRLVTDVAREAKGYLLFGSASYGSEQGRNYFLNSAYLVDPQGTVAGRYDKVHLVPYGEYVPLRRFFFFLDKLVVGVGDFRSGKALEPLRIGENKAGVLICYEGIFPEISRSYKRKGASLLVNITNDAWFGTSSAPYQHLTMTAFRAVENRLYIVRAANTGISAIIAPTGEIVARTPLFEQAVLDGAVGFMGYRTFYSQYGDIFVYICFAATGMFFIVKRRRRKK
jgi:apolipoprotein N-acyltransferase